MYIETKQQAFGFMEGSNEEDKTHQLKFVQQVT